MNKANHTLPLKRLGRLFWLVIVAITIPLWVLATRELLSAGSQSCLQALCDPLVFSLEDLEILKVHIPALLPVSRILSVLVAAYSLVFFAVAGLIFWRRSDDWIALLVSFTLIYLGAVLFTSGDDFLIRAYPALRPLMQLLDALGLTAWISLFYFFPDGRFFPRQLAAPVSALLAVNLIISFTAPISEAASRGGPISLVIFIGLMAMGLFAQIHRYRHHSTPPQRQQTKWVLFGLFGVLLGVVVWTGVLLLFPPNQPSLARSNLLFLAMPAVVVLMGSLPVSLGFSILHARLWDIDIIIRRTLIYSALIGLLVLVYFASVLALQNLILAFSGQQSPLAIVISTLAIAALFNPLRNRIQRAIDRQFYRQRYDAAQTMADFHATTREEVDLNRLSLALLAVVEETLKPSGATLWVRSMGSPPTSDDNISQRTVLAKSDTDS